MVKKKVNKKVKVKVKDKIEILIHNNANKLKNKESVKAKSYCSNNGEKHKTVSSSPKQSHTSTFHKTHRYQRRWCFYILKYLFFQQYFEWYPCNTIIKMKIKTQISLILKRMILMQVRKFVDMKTHNPKSNNIYLGSLDYLELYGYHKKV